MGSVYSSSEGLAQIQSIKRWALLIVVTGLRLGQDRDSPPTDLGEDGPWPVCQGQLLSSDAYRHSQCAAWERWHRLWNQSVLESWLSYCVTLNKLMTSLVLVSLIIYGYSSSYREGFVGVNERRCLQLIALLGYSRCSTRSSFHCCHHRCHWVPSGPSVLRLEVSPTVGLVTCTSEAQEELCLLLPFDSGRAMKAVKIK